MITTYMVRASTAACQGLENSDPKAWHGYVDAARADVLKAIADGHPDAAALAAAVLDATAVPADTQHTPEVTVKVSRELMGYLADWSEPVQVMVERLPDGEYTA